MDNQAFEQPPPPPYYESANTGGGGGAAASPPVGHPSQQQYQSKIKVSLVFIQLLLGISRLTKVTLVLVF